MSYEMNYIIEVKGNLARYGDIVWDVNNRMHNKANPETREIAQIFEQVRRPLYDKVVSYQTCLEQHKIAFLPDSEKAKINLILPYTHFGYQILTDIDTINKITNTSIFCLDASRKELATVKAGLQTLFKDFYGEDTSRSCPKLVPESIQKTNNLLHTRLDIIRNSLPVLVSSYGIFPKINEGR